jgi:chromosomal replication initiator protein
LPASDQEVVAALDEAIRRRIGEPRYNLWFHNKTKLRWDDRELIVGVPNHFYQEWMQKTFAGDVRAAAGDVAGLPVAVGFVIDPELFQAARRAEAAVGEQGLPVKVTQGPRPAARPEAMCVAVATATKAPPVPARPRRPARRWHRLDDFISGAGNRVAHASALSVVESPGQDANPLVLHGPVGTGKTHLLEGIYVGLRKGQPEWRVCFATAEEFTSRFVQAMRLGKLGGFRKQFRDSDALLLDDVHFLATKRATQEEFLHTLDALLTEGRQVAITCDCHPRLADEFLPELTDRLLGGAIWGLMPPDEHTRLHLLRAQAVRVGKGSVPDEVLQLLAEQLRGNVRELHGAIHSLCHFSRVSGKDIDLALAREALSDLLRHSVRVVRLDDVDRAVCATLRMETGALKEKQRGWKHSHPRMLAMHLARKHTAASYSEVGQYFGGRSHSTVVAAQKKVRQWLRDDNSLVLGERQFRVGDVIERIERELLR